LLGQGVLGDLAGAAPARDLGSQVTRFRARQEQSAKHGTEGPRGDRDAGTGSKAFHGGVRLLGGEPSLLDREAGRVARGVDVLLA